MKRAVLVGVLVAALVACSDPGPGTVQPYDRAPVPPVPNRTTEVTAQGDLADGQYWATVTGANSGDPSPTITWVLVVASFDELGDVHTVEEPSRQVASPIAAVLSASVVGSDRQNYAVPADELLSLLLDNPPSDDAPDTYTYMPYPFLVTVTSGVVVDVRQIWLENFSG